jgi:hypothetical protein
VVLFATVARHDRQPGDKTSLILLFLGSYEEGRSEPALREGKILPAAEIWCGFFLHFAAKTGTGNRAKKFFIF